MYPITIAAYLMLVHMHQLPPVLQYVPCWVYGPTNPNLHDLFILPYSIIRCQIYSSIHVFLNIEAGYSVETLVSTYRTTQHHKPQVYNMNILLLFLLAGIFASQSFLGHMHWSKCLPESFQSCSDLSQYAFSQ